VEDNVKLIGCEGVD